MDRDGGSERDGSLTEHRDGKMGSQGHRAATPPAAAEQISRMLSESSAAKRNLGQALDERDKSARFDRCMVDGEGCKRTAISAHCIPETMLELIMNSSRKVVAAHSAAPKAPMHWLLASPLKKMSIGKFNAAKWSCRPHDDIFRPLDTQQLMQLTDRHLFLLIYKITAYLTHRALHTGARLALPMLDPAIEAPLGLSHETETDLQAIARHTSISVIRVWWIKQAMDNILDAKDYRKIEYRATSWNTVPTMAAIGMKFVDGPGNFGTWFGENSLIPVWIALLPQEHGQTIVTASARGWAKYADDFHAGVSKKLGEFVSGDAPWTKLICRKVLANCTDVAIREERFTQLHAHEKDTLVEFFRYRSLVDDQRLALPNLLDGHDTPLSMDNFTKTDRANNRPSRLYQP